MADGPANTRQQRRRHGHKPPATSTNCDTTKRPQSRHLRCRRLRTTTTTTNLAVAALILLAACCCSSGPLPLCANALPSPSTGSSGGLTLRVRLPDGAVKRVKAASGDTVDEIMGKLGVGGAGEGLSTDATAGSKVVDGSVSVAALGLGNGDFLYVKSNAAAEAAAKAKADSLSRLKAAAAGAKARGSKFVPFPEYARPPPPRATKRVKTWQDIEAMQAQTFSVKPQKDSNVKKVSVEQSAMDDFVSYLKETGLGKHRCALLFGRISPGTKGVKVEAMYEPQQRGGADGFSYYDSSALTDAAAAAVAAATMVEGEGDAESCEAESAAAADVGRAVRVAELLGLRLVGWCLSHDKREHFMAARDVVTAAALQLMSMAEKGTEEGVLMATVTVPVNSTDGEVATEAFSVSNQTVQMSSEGIFATDQPDPAGDRVATTVAVKEDSKETTTPDALGLIGNVAIVQHEGILQTRFPAANRARPASLSDLKACLFEPVTSGGAAGKKGTKKQKQPSFLKRLSDFQLLVFLSRQMGFSRDFEQLCAVVQKRDAKSPALGKLKVVLENLCDA